MSRGPDAAALLERALIKAALTDGIAISIIAADWTRWASATFVGARHELTLLTTSSPAMDAWLASLSEDEFQLPGHLVADLCVVGATREGQLTTVSLEALTVESH